MTARLFATDALCVFVKEPLRGRAKTRLAASIGDAAAAQLANAFIEDTLAVASRLHGVRVTIALSGSAAGLPRSALDFPIIPQGAGSLGTRLERCLRYCLKDASVAVVIGTDSPGLPLPMLASAFEQLAYATAVIGPAEDGGFYLLGTKLCPVGLLDGVPWSTSETLTRTVAGLAAAGISVTQLASWFDVDTVADLEQLRRLLMDGVVHAPATARVLGL